MFTIILSISYPIVRLVDLIILVFLSHRTCYRYVLHSEDPWLLHAPIELARVSNTASSVLREHNHTPVQNVFATESSKTIKFQQFILLFPNQMSKRGEDFISEHIPRQAPIGTERSGSQVLPVVCSTRALGKEKGLSVWGSGFRV